VEAGGTDTPGVECVPEVAAATGPEVVFAGRPTAEWTSNLGARGAEAFLVAKFAVQNTRRFGRIIRDSAHVAIL
jgi:hypothetical protein